MSVRNNNNSLILQMKNIHASYDQTKALQGVDFNLYKGEIHALVGEHRAGKSTLVNLLSGAVRKTEGEIVYNNKRIDFFTPISSMRSKIGIVYQNLNIIPALNAIENIFTGQMKKKWYQTIDYATMKEDVKQIFRRLNVSINLETPVKNLSVKEQQMVELARALSINPRIIILDEISSKLTPHELETIYKIILEFKSKGKSIIYISHNLDEIFEFADRVTILKDGHRRGTEAIKDLDRIKLIKLTYSFMLSREELKRDNKELFFYKKYNENIIKNLPLGVIILDIHNKIYLINYASIKILELANVSVENEDLETLFNKDSIDEYDLIIEKIKVRKKYTWDKIDYKKEKKIKINIFPFKDEYYDFLGTIIMIEDITRESQFSNYLLKTEKFVSVAKLAASIVHEVRTPLSTIRCNLFTLLKDKKFDPDCEEKLKMIEQQSNEIDEITESLFSFSKLQQAPMKKVNLIDIIDEVVILVNLKINAKNITLIWENQNKNVFIFGNENRLKHIFINLLVNSIEAVLEDNGVIKIGLQIIPVKNIVEIVIVDNGYGIPENIRDKIFEFFFSTKLAKKNGGLGLAVCKEIVKSHKGKIDFTSNNGETKFKVSFPLVEFTKSKRICPVKVH